MERLRVAGLGLAFLVLTACGDKADTPECREWTEKYAFMGTYNHPEVPATDFTLAKPASNIGDLMQATMLDDRPDGCPIPPG